MALEPGPMQVIKNFHSTKDEVLDDIKKLDLWPTVYVSERMEELPPHWHDLDNCCLLYTSPSPRDRSLSRMPSSA